MLAGTVVAPGHAMALPMMPEFIAPQDGAEKQDCERNAAQRWLAAHAKRLVDLRPIYLGDDLFACQPVADAVTAAGGTSSSPPNPHRTRRCMTSCKVPRSMSTRSRRRPTASA